MSNLEVRGGGFKKLWNVKQIIQVEANSSNNFTINLQDYYNGNSILDRSKIKVYTMINSIELNAYSKGYEIKVEDVNVGGRFPIYRVTVPTTKMNDTLQTLYERTDKNDYDVTITIPSNIYSFCYAGSYSTRSHSNFWLWVNGNLVKHENLYSSTIFTGLIVPKLNSINTVRIKYIGGGSKRYHVQSGLLGTTSINTIDTSAKINCFFVIERD